MDQYERIRKAARELSEALTEQAYGATFDVSARAIEITCAEDLKRRYDYQINVTKIGEEIC